MVIGSEFRFLNLDSAIAVQQIETTDHNHDPLPCATALGLLSELFSYLSSKTEERLNRWTASIAGKCPALTTLHTIRKSHSYALRCYRCTTDVDKKTKNAKNKRSEKLQMMDIDSKELKMK